MSFPFEFSVPFVEQLLARWPVAVYAEPGFVWRVADSRTGDRPGCLVGRGPTSPEFDRDCRAFDQNVPYFDEKTGTIGNN